MPASGLLVRLSECIELPALFTDLQVIKYLTSTF